MLPANGRAARPEGDELPALLVGRDEERMRGRRLGGSGARALEGGGQGQELVRPADIVVDEERHPGRGRDRQPVGDTTREVHAVEGQHHPAQDRVPDHAPGFGHPLTAPDRPRMK